MPLTPEALERAREVGRSLPPPTPEIGARMRLIWAVEPPADEARAS